MSEKQSIKYIQFPMQFNVALLNQDLARVLQYNWTPHFNSIGYEGNWNALSLYGIEGNAENVQVPLSLDANLCETKLLHDCPYLQEVIKSFAFPLLSVRLMRLEAGAVIKPHRDHELGYEDGQFRLHIPIVTNDEVYFILDGERLKMDAGTCWYTNVNYMHEVANKSSEDRVHLVIDGVRNEWSDALFFSEAKPSQFFTPIKKLDLETTQRVIEELLLQGIPENSEIIIALKNNV